MATLFRRKATVLALGVLTLTLAGGGIAAAARPAAQAPATSAQPGARQPGSTAQPPVSAADARRARSAMNATLAAPATGTVAWAVVSANGTLLQHSANVKSAQRFTCCGLGQYEVLLDYDVHAKAYVGTVGTADSANVPPGGEASVAPRYLIPNAVFVQTRSSSGSAADRPFHLVISN
ncbi:MULTISPECIES: hypothetical protein [Micromonospora]|uniref:Secreted protein n=1 Tax=Micromonospora solifontis TaxID=2487138 RepID=A0ABX9WLT1_9ACTN|nr:MULTISPECIES: hypothetical protein [Micromonospora]NES14063.1 hypothetical protein [Micromonospora sp. PPF5-17B]NES35693.1 hypothetical protein [Micromonospora solifontis]NES56060.1 hypothetical protein [Micromonospora sp. PPF5-6]RNM00374.1 hypothetical protein EFE23_05875 [Micromonospora solifontis]